MANKKPDPTDEYVGSRVRMRRLMVGLSQEKLGKALGLTFQQVQKYEKGTNRIGAGRLQCISDVLEVPVEFFFEGTLPPQSEFAEEPAMNFVKDFLATSDGLALTKAFMEIKDVKLRRNIVHLVEGIANDRGA